MDVADGAISCWEVQGPDRDCRAHDEMCGVWRAFGAPTEAENHLLGFGAQPLVCEAMRKYTCGRTRVRDGTSNAVPPTNVGSRTTHAIALYDARCFECGSCADTYQRRELLLALIPDALGHQRRTVHHADLRSDIVIIRVQLRNLEVLVVIGRVQ